jgi:hypothetical protein
MTASGIAEDRPYASTGRTNTPPGVSLCMKCMFLNGGCADVGVLEESACAYAAVVHRLDPSVAVW